jgi:hypothetical protein
MVWKENLFQNLLSLLILLILGTAIYCKIAKVTLTEFISQIKGSLESPIEE